jgi:hypothetical protein
MNPWARKAPLESDLQADCMAYAVSRGWFAEKIMRTRRNGFPDYFFLRDGVLRQVEFKRPGEKPTAQQTLRIGEIRAHGGTVYVIDNIDEFKRLFS